MLDSSPAWAVPLDAARFPSEKSFLRGILRQVRTPRWGVTRHSQVTSPRQSPTRPEFSDGISEIFVMASSLPLFMIMKMLGVICALLLVTELVVVSRCHRHPMPSAAEGSYQFIVSS